MVINLGSEYKMINRKKTYQHRKGMNIREKWLRIRMALSTIYDKYSDMQHLLLGISSLLLLKSEYFIKT